MTIIEKRYWVQVFSPRTWEQFLAAGAKVTGFREFRWNAIQKINPGDILLCYLSGVSSWIGILEVKSPPYLDTVPLWSEELFPCRADVELLLALPSERAIPIRQLKALSIFRVKNWSLYLISSPARWTPSDGRIVEGALWREMRDLDGGS